MSILDLWDQKDKTITLLEFCTILMPYILRFVHGAVAKKLKPCLLKWLGGQGACTLLFCEHYTNRACTYCLHPASSKAKKCEGNYECEGGYDVADVSFCEKCRKLSVMQGMCKSCNVEVTRTNMARPTYSNAHSLKWADAVANLGLSNRAAVILATVRLLFWHLAQPVLFAVLVFKYQKELNECCCFEGAAFCLPSQLWFVFAKEMIYALTVMFCMYLFPVYLLMDVNASYDELKRRYVPMDSLLMANLQTNKQETLRAINVINPQLRAWLFGYSVYILCPEFVLFFIFWHWLQNQNSFREAHGCLFSGVKLFVCLLFGDCLIFSLIVGLPVMIVSLSRYSMPLALYPTVLFTGLTALWICLMVLTLVSFHIADLKRGVFVDNCFCRCKAFLIVYVLAGFSYLLYWVFTQILCDDSVAGHLCYPNQTAAFNVTNTTFANATNVSGVR